MAMVVLVTLMILIAIAAGPSRACAWSLFKTTQLETPRLANGLSWSGATGLASGTCHSMPLSERQARISALTLGQRISHHYCCHTQRFCAYFFFF